VPFQAIRGVCQRCEVLPEKTSIANGVGERNLTLALNAKKTRIKSFVLKNEQKLLWVLVALTFLLRFSYTCYAYSTHGTENWKDDWEYLSYGQEIAEGNWHPVHPKREGEFMTVGPAMPILIAASIRLFGDTHWPIFLYNITITSLVVWILFYLGKYVFDRRIGWLLALWGTLFAQFTIYNPYLLKEPTNFFFLPLTVFLLVKSIRKSGAILPLVMSALSYIWLIHADERYLVYAPLFALSFLLIRPFNFKLAMGRVSIWGIAVLVLMVPWTIRNYKVFNQIVLISPRTTVFTAKICGDDISNLHVINHDTDAVEASRSYYKRKHFKRYNEYNVSPREFGKYEKYIRAFINFWQPTYFRPTFIQYGFRFRKWSLGHNLCGLLGYGLFLPFYFIGIFIMKKRKNALGLFIAAIPIIHSLVHTLMVWSLERYRSPVVFCVICVGLWMICEIHKGRKFLSAPR